jgi:outer membrane usher protein
VNGQKYRTTNGKGIVLYDNLTPFRENALMLDVSDSHSTTELKGNRKMVAPYRGAVVVSHFDTDQRKPWLIHARQAAGEPLPFGYEIEDNLGHNVGVVGQGSLLYIRTDTIPSTLKVAVDKANNQYCTITFKQTIDEAQTYVCR